MLIPCLSFLCDHSKTSGTFRKQRKECKIIWCLSNLTKYPPLRIPTFDFESNFCFLFETMGVDSRSSSSNEQITRKKTKWSGQSYMFCLCFHGQLLWQVSATPCFPWYPVVWWLYLRSCWPEKLLTVCWKFFVHAWIGLGWNEINLHVSQRTGRETWKWKK